MGTRDSSKPRRAVPSDPWSDTEFELRTRAGDPGSASSGPPRTRTGAAVSGSDEEKTRAALSRIGAAQEFARRQSFHKRWVVVAGLVSFCVALSPMVWAIAGRDWRPLPLLLLPAVLALMFLRALKRYAKGSPACPNCRQDVTNCAARFCHLCGRELRTSVCAHCGADPTWTAEFQPIGRQHQPILFCAGCGVYLNSPFYRFENEPN